MGGHVYFLHSVVLREALETFSIHLECGDVFSRNLYISSFMNYELVFKICVIAYDP